MTITCSRCRSDAESVMSFDYSSRLMWLSDIEGQLEPGAGYLLCVQHAGRLSPPVGWTLVDRRSPMARLFPVPA
ncbi:MAG: DUF3499 family protein [Acidimicrobiia bacterium]|nr:DUF3499 family protein [Acidimicrobiia bacterium]